MFFNPLFIDTSSAGAMQNQKNTKLGKSQYLFSDIIKISLSQSDSTDTGATPLFNLSLVNNMNSISSLFSTVNTNAVKSAVKGGGDAQNADTMLFNFLQFAFFNQDIQTPEALKLQDLMKDKELLLSKESLTTALSQLLQIYQPAGQNESGKSSDTANPEQLAGNILASLDDKGKVVLNFNNSASQIKIELTKLNNEEKELFISTKIIPMNLQNLTKNAEGKADAEKLPVESNSQTVKNENITDLNAENSGDSKNIQNSNNSVKESLLDIKKAQTTENKAEAPVPQIESAPQNDQSNAALLGNTGKITDTAKAIVPGTDNLTKEKKTTDTIVDVSKPELKTQSEDKNNEYKLRVVEVSAEKIEKNQDAKIYSMNPFEKNLLKKSTITYTSSTAETNKNTTSGEGEKQNVKLEGNPDTVKTVEQAEKQILKTNTLLFDANEKEESPDAVNTKTVPGKKGNNADSIKVDQELNAGKANSKESAGGNSKLSKSEPGNQPENNVLLDKNTKKIEMLDTAGNQLKIDMNKSVKNATVIEDNNSKNNEIKNDSVNSNADGDKKLAIENDKSSLKQDVDAGQKDASSSGSQNNADKKGNENKIFTVQNVADKDKVLFGKDEGMKEFAKQADVAKTVKTYEIIKEIKSFIEQGNKSSMTLKIMPENLGSVKISLDIVKNMVQARIDVDSENVKQFVQTNLDSLKQSLSQSGVNVSMLQVNVSSSEQKQQRFVAPHKRKGNGLGKEASFDESDTSLNQKILGYNSYDYLV